MTAIDPVRDLQELARLGLSQLTEQHFETDLVQAYRNAGLERSKNTGFAKADALLIETTWGKRLSRSSKRSVRRLRFTAV